MMESLPRSSVVVVEAIPVFLEKLQVIQCMDVAEQSLTALEMLSRRHSKNILHAKGVSSVLTYIDFFSINAQRSALSITANSCQNLSREEFDFVKDSVSILCNHLTAGDKKSCESTCLAFSRLVDSFPNEADILTQIACPQLLPNLQQLLLVTPQTISTTTFVSVVRMLATLCATCPSLAVDLLKLHITQTLRFLFLGSNSTDECLELSNRSPQEFYELTSLVSEMMPRLPKDGIFKVDSLLLRQQSYSIQAVWQYKDERGVWHSYDAADNKILEAGHSTGEEEVNLASMGHNFLVDFSTMTQVNEETGATRPVQRRTNLTGGKAPSKDTDDKDILDPRAEFLENEPQTVHDFVRSLFPVLFEVYSSSGGPTVKHKCLQALLRIIYYSPSTLLDSVLKNQGVSRHVAAMLASPDHRIVVGSLQMANILMQKLPHVFCTFFRREGVMHQMRKLIIEDSEVDAFMVKGLQEESTSSSIEASLAMPPCFEAIPSTSFGNLSFSSGSPSASSSPVAIPDQDKSNPPGKIMRNKKTSSTRHSKTASSVVLKKRAESTTTSTEGKQSTNRTTSTSKAPTISTRSHSDCDVVEGLESTTTPMTAAYSLPSTSQGLERSLLSAQSPSSSRGARNSRLTNAASKTSSFLANLHPSRWGRWGATTGGPPSSLPSSSSCSRPSTLSSISHDHLTASSRNLSSVNRDKVRAWIKEQAIEFESKYFSTPDEESLGSSDGHPSLNTLNQLTFAVESLNMKDVIPPLEEIKNVLQGSDISPFELIHSKIVEKLIEFLTSDSGNFSSPRNERITSFLHVFIGSPKTNAFKEIDKQCPLNLSTAPFSALVAKLNGCITQLEQFPVRVHDVIGTGSGSVRGTSALKFFNTHQLKCNLQRHPSVRNLKQWKGGAVKIDPLALVQAIERYLVIRGYGRIRDNDEEGSDDDNSDEELDDNMTAMLLNQGQGRHKLQFFIGDNLLPYNMTVYQAIRQFASNSSEGQESDMDCDGHLANANLWGQTHVIYYRPYSDTPLNISSPSSSSGNKVASTSKKTGKNSKQSPKRKDDLWNEGKVPRPISPVDEFLVQSLPSSANITDASADSIALLRILNALNRYWGHFYDINRSYKPAISNQEFVNIKLTAKANRQLQDPLVIMTGNLPTWLSCLANVCPFLFPFETRHLLFYVTCFDRDRALQRLLDSIPGLNSNDTTERVTPRLDRRKKTVSREDLLRQAEVVLQDVSSSKSLLEIQYENEVGTGLGPTLEFYALVSQELQRADLDIWRGEVIGLSQS
jgi:E3 ubiquitin-protein ligase TRIP12